MLINFIKYNVKTATKVLSLNACQKNLPTGMPMLLLTTTNLAKAARP